MDQIPPEQPSEGSADGAGPELIPAQEVADVLAEASKLSNELARQLDGEDAVPIPAATPSNFPESPDVDQQLDDVDALLAITADELSATPSDDSDESQPEPGREEVGPVVPDFMDEFTHPETQSADASGPTGESSAHGGADAQHTQGVQSGPKPGVVGTGAVGVATSNAPEPQPPSKEQPVTVAPRRRIPNPREQFAKLVRVLVSAGKGMLNRLFPVAERVVGVLEKTDRPFGWMKEPVRRITGWIAIATLGTSMFVFLWSLI